jgi:hypothetical protein
MIGLMRAARRYEERSDDAVTIVCLGAPLDCFAAHAMTGQMKKIMR